MNILWTNHGLARPGGTEIVTRDYVPELARRGHRVEVLTSRPGAIADELRSQGITVHETPATLGGGFDLIHGQHYLETTVALAALPGVPALFFCHGNPDRGWIEQPVIHPRCLRLITNCDNLAHHLARTLPMPREDIGVVGNGYDPLRFPAARPVPAELRRALFFHNTLTRDSPEWQVALQACRQGGIELDAIGSGFGNPVADPERVLPEYDLVFAFGRSAMESIVSGCAVVLIGLQRSAGLVGIDDLEALDRSNFTRGRRILEVTSEAIAADLRAWQPAAAVALAAAVRERFTVAAMVDLLEREYSDLVARAAGAAAADPAEEARATALHLHRAWCHLADSATAAGSAERAARRAVERRQVAERKLADAKQRLRVVEKVLQRGWFRRPAWRAVQRHWRKLEADPRQGDEPGPGK